jgi:hypothetical protein
MTGALLLLTPLVLFSVAFVLMLTASKRKPIAVPPVPTAQVVVERSHTPIDPPRSTTRSVSGGRIAAALLFMVLGGLAVMFLVGLAGLAQLASH